ncbi:MAG: hypothetical protein ACKVHR_18805 [Pirellulales bacterium]|jgi:hypothetical protein
MTHPLHKTFNQISDNNKSVDQTIESLVNNACNQEDEDNDRGDRIELEKTTSLMFISSLILGERDDLEIEPLD